MSVFNTSAAVFNASAIGISGTTDKVRVFGATVCRAVTAGVGLSNKESSALRARSNVAQAGSSVTLRVYRRLIGQTEFSAQAAAFLGKRRPVPLTAINARPSASFALRLNRKRGLSGASACQVDLAERAEIRGYWAKHIRADGRGYCLTDHRTLRKVVAFGAAGTQGGVFFFDVLRVMRRMNGGTLATAGAFSRLHKSNTDYVPEDRRLEVQGINRVFYIAGA